LVQADEIYIPVCPRTAYFLKNPDHPDVYVLLRMPRRRHFEGETLMVKWQKL